MMRQKLLHRMKGGVWHYQSYDEGRTDSGRASSGWNPAFNLYFIYVTGFEKRDLIAHFEKIELLLP